MPSPAKKSDKAATRTSTKKSAVRSTSRAKTTRSATKTLESAAKTTRSAAKSGPLRAATRAAGGAGLPTGLPDDIRAYHAAQAAADRSICDVLAAAIERNLTGGGAAGVERKIWHRHPVWFIDGNPIVGYHKLKGPPPCIRLLFWSGRSFDEPGLAPEGGFQTAGARFTAAGQIPAADLPRWLEKSARIQWDYKNIVKRKGRLERLK